MKVITTIKDIKEEIKKIKLQNLLIGLIPTMGCIHDAHLQLINDIRKHCKNTEKTTIISTK